MKEEQLNIRQLFRTEKALQVLPETIHVWHELKLKEAQIDIIINGFNKAELSNATALNYLLLEDKIPVNIIIVESSGKKKVYDKLINHEKVSKILIEDHKAKHPVYGPGSYGMAVSSAVGFYYTKSPYVFFSHNDMIALKKDFLGHLLSKLNSNLRIASFTQRHVIPFTGCMLIDRNVVNNSNTDWLLYDENPYIKQSKFLKNLCLLKETGKENIKCDWIDAGEAYIFEEIANQKQVYISASFGGTKGLWKTPFELLKIEETDIIKLESEYIPIIYGKLRFSKKRFKQKYKHIIKAGKKWENLKWFFSRKKNYWRYTLDDNNELIFIHHGRGTRRTINRWMKFVTNLNQNLR